MRIFQACYCILAAEDSGNVTHVIVSRCDGRRTVVNQQIFH